MKRWMTVRLGLAMLGLFAMAGLLPSQALAEGATLFHWWGGSYEEDTVFEYSPVAVPTDVTSVETTYSAGLALKADGTVWELDWRTGDWAMVPGLSDIIAIPNSDTLALKRDGTVWTWGGNSCSPSPMPGLSNVVDIANGAAVKSDGTVWVWGYDPVTGTNRLSPVQVKMADGTPLGGVIRIRAFGTYFAIKSNDTVWVWGTGYFGDGIPASSGSTPRKQATPIQHPYLSGVGVQDITSTWDTFWARKADGTVLSWGDNYSGGCGSGHFDKTQATQFHLTPGPVVQQDGSPLSNIVAVAGSHALTRDGRVWTWGRTSGVLLSKGVAAPDYPYAVPVPYLVDATGVAFQYVLQRAPPQIEVGNSTVFVPEGGTSSIRIRLGTAPAASVTVNATVTGDADVTVQSGARLTFNPSNWDQWQTITLAAAEDADTVDGTAEISLVAEGYTTGIKVQAYEVDNDSTSGSAVWVWGGNARGQLGDDTTSDRLSPVLTISGTAIACGLGHSVVLGTDRKVWTCGRNDAGQLGDGNTTDRKLPVQAQISNVIAVAAADVQTVAVKADGTVWRWGAPWVPSQPPGSFLKSMTPTQVPGLTTAIAVAAGREHLVALANGTVWTWGYNKYGELGNGGANNAFPNPVMVSGLSGVTAIAAREYFTVACKADGSVWAWGENGSGQLGDGTLVMRTTPVKVSGLSNVVAIAAGGSVSGQAGGGHTLALKADGSVWAWGLNSVGQLGDGTTINRTTPVRVSGLTNAMGIAAGGFHSVARTRDGRVWTWGYNGCGQLGDGTTTGRLSPVPVLGLAGVVAIAAGDTHTMAVGATGGARPVAVDDVYSTPQDTALFVAASGVLANDTGTGLTAVKVSDPAHGTAVLVPDGGFVYVPQPGYSGEDNFAYKPLSGTMDGNVAAVRLTIVANNNHPPTITTAAAATPNPVTLPAGTTVSAAASDPDGNPLTYAWTQVTGPGAATFAAPTAASSGVTFSGAGEYRLQVTVSDGRGGSVSSSVLVTVNLNFDIRADVNHDGAVNALDAQIIIKNFGSSTPK